MGKKILIAVTSHGELGTTQKPTGYYLSEVTHPFFAFLAAGFAPDDIDLVSVKGGEPPMDPSSRDLSDPHNKEFLERYIAKLQTLRPIDVQPANYQAIFFAGGHGVMWDFPNATELHTIATTIYEQQHGVVAAVCHGPAALVNLKLSNGTFLVEGKKIAAFTDEEERAVGLDHVVPFLLSSTLASKGAILQPAPAWQANVAIDGRLVTGQNPASATGVGEAIVGILQKKA